MTKAKSCRILKRLLVLMLTFALLANLAVPVLAAATDVIPAPYPDLKVTLNSTSGGYGSWESKNSENTEFGITIYGRGSSGNQCALYFTNTGTQEKVLSFNASAVFGEGANNAYVQIATGRTGGNELLKTSTNFENQEFRISLAPSAVLRVLVKSSNGTDIPVTVSVTNLKFVKDSSASTTFLPAENGSYTVDGEAITTETVLEKDASEGYAVEAAPAEGYQFYGWYEKTTDRVISTTASTTLSFDNDSVVTALFVPAVAAGEEVYGVEMENGYVPFIKFADAAGFSVAMGRPQVTLLKNYTLTESITIPNGVTLLVPFDDARTLYTEEPAIDTKTVLMVTSPSAYVTPSAYRTLTMASGVNITIENGGALSLSGKISAVGTGQKSYNGTPTGPDGRIVMQGSNRIDVENGGSLYAYGYISGSGSVHAKSGSKVYECFQLRNWRGGNATLGLASSDVFPVSMYYVQNIEVPLTLDAGAAEIARSAVNASSTAMGAGVTFIGAGGMFQVSNGSVTKEYHPATDRLEITLDGDASLTSIQLKVPEMEVMLPQGIDSANFALPINNNITVNCTAGSDVQIHQDISMLPGSVLNIDEGATVTLDSSTEVYVFDRDDYVGKGYVAGHDGDNNVDFIPVGYSATNGTAAIRTNADLTDAKVNVNGTVIVNGGFYTTENGGAIVSLGKTGKVVFANGAGTLTETHMATQSSNVATVVNVPVNPAWLQNGDASYVLTAEAENGDEYPYSAAEDKWLEPFHGYTIRFDANGGSGEMPAMQVTEDEAADGVELPDNGFSRPGYTFVGWSEDPDCLVEDVWRYEGDPIYPADEFESKDITMYAIWEEQAGTYVVTFDANGGEGSMEPQVITDDVPTPLNLNTFTREDYNFIGWSVSPDGEKQFSDGQTITGEDDLYLYALWQKDHYVLTFHSNYEPDKTVTQEIPLNLDSITLQLNTFTREGYVFMGWAFSPNAVRADLRDGATLGFDEDTDLYAVWEKNTFQIFFDANGGEGSMDPLTVVRDVSTPLTKNAFTREGYDFIGWATVPNGQIEFEDEAPITTDSVEDFTLYAQWAVKEYTITFKNDDGTVLETYRIEHGETPVYHGSEPAKDATAQYTYTFSGWSPAIQPATQDQVYTAKYVRETNKYDVVFVDEDGTELARYSLEYGALPVYNGETPTKADTAQYDYEFAGWSPAIKKVDGDQTYTATYSETLRSYTVTWVNEDGTELKVDTVDYGVVPTYTGATPTKAATAQYTYTFAGWTPEIAAVTGEATYTATYTAEENSYVLSFNANGGEGEMEDKTLVYGVETDLPANSFTYSDHYFMGWNTESDGSGTAYAKNGKIAITADTVLYAQWAPDGWYRDENGLQYYVEGEPLKTGWTKLDDGNWYYFYPETGYAATGYAMVPYAPAETGHEYGPYEVDLKPEAGHPEYAELGYANNGEFVFDENGVFQINYTGKIVKNGSEWWCQYGEILWHARLVTDGEYYYYGSAGGALKRSVTSYIGDTNGLLPAGTYTFDDEARIIMYNGIITMEDGKWYYENGRRTYAGLFQPEGSEDYYYAASDGRIICGQEHYATKTNGLFPAGIYTFDEEGRMLINGLYEFGGELWYFENGVKTPKGLIEWKGDYYYIKQNGAAVRGSDYYVSEAKANGLFPAGVYTFGPDGKMVIPEQTTKNGLVWEDGKLWYYVENVRTHAGLIQVDGYYYYIKSNGQAVTDMRYFVSNPNGLMDRAYHNFDDQGRMTDVPAEKNGLVEENGKLWYYENGEKAHPGLILVDGDYYYICTTGYAVADCDYFISNTNGLMEKGTYHFNADGKMVVPEPDTRTGLYEENGELVYYLDGVKTHAGLIEWEGNYYYIKSNCTAVRDCDYFVSNPNGLVAVGWYHFNADGTMVQP